MDSRQEMLQDPPMLCFDKSHYINMLGDKEIRDSTSGTGRNRTGAPFFEAEGGKIAV